jgi:hypothetical protein
MATPSQFLFMGIRHQLPFPIVLSLAFDALTGGKRSFREDALVCIEKLNPPLRVLGKENIPQSGPCVVTVNHYHRPGFGAEWLALGISACVPREMHWVMTAEWTAPGKWYEPIKGTYSRWLLKRLARVYAYTSMPPMPPRPGDVEQRARSVRRVLEYVKKHPDCIVGLAPEGADQVGGKLSVPAPGVGRFALLLAGSGSAFVPVGAYETDRELCLHFGPAYRLSVPSGSSTDEKDRAVAGIMMEHIAVLLPEELRGEFT